MAPELLLSLTLACAPLVHPETALRLVKHESGNNPYAIGINGPYRLSPQPNSQAQAVATAKMLMASGLSIDMGLGMINSRNLGWLGLSVESVFDPCTNLQAMQSILTAGYSKAYKRHGNSQQALVEALSSYNTGHPSNGVRNGYVAAVVGTRLPPITGAQSQPNWNTAQ
jgi:type IV secretion system protein VirB1